jgi:hypothetical protein
MQSRLGAVALQQGERLHQQGWHNRLRDLQHGSDWHRVHVLVDIEEPRPDAGMRLVEPVANSGLGRLLTS